MFAARSSLCHEPPVSRGKTRRTLPCPRMRQRDSDMGLEQRRDSNRLGSTRSTGLLGIFFLPRQWRGVVVPDSLLPRGLCPAAAKTADAAPLRPTQLPLRRVRATGGAERLRRQRRCPAQSERVHDVRECGVQPGGRWVRHHSVVLAARPTWRSPPSRGRLGRRRVDECQSGCAAAAMRCAFGVYPGRQQRRVAAMGRPSPPPSHHPDGLSSDRSPRRPGGQGVDGVGAAAVAAAVPCTFRSRPWCSDTALTAWKPPSPPSRHREYPEPQNSPPAPPVAIFLYKIAAVRKKSCLCGT